MNENPETGAVRQARGVIKDVAGKLSGHQTKERRDH